MNLRSHSKVKPTAATLLAPIAAGTLLLSAFAADVFSGSTVYRGRNGTDRLESETAPLIRGDLVAGSENHPGLHAKTEMPGGWVVGISNLKPQFVVRGNNSITGFVFSDTRRPIPNIHVELLNDVGATVSRTKTAVSGLFAFRGLGEGVFYVKVLPYGLNYVGMERRVPLISFSARPGFGSVSEQVDFYLAPKNASSAPLAAPGVVFAQEVPKEAELLYQEGIELIAGKHEEKGFERLRRAIEIFPKYFNALDRLGNEYVLRKHYRPAAILLGEALKVNPRSFSSLFGLGLAHFRLNNFEQAITSFDRSIELYKESVQANLWYGISLHAAGRYNEAEMALNVAGKLSKGKSPEVHWQLARVYKDQGRFGEAAAELESLLRLKPDTPDADEIKKTIVLLKQKSTSAS